MFRESLGIIFYILQNIKHFFKDKKKIVQNCLFLEHVVYLIYIHTVQYTEEYIDFDNREHM